MNCIAHVNRSKNWPIQSTWRCFLACASCSFSLSCVFYSNWKEAFVFVRSLLGIPWVPVSTVLETILIGIVAVTGQNKSWFGEWVWHVYNGKVVEYSIAGICYQVTWGGVKIYLYNALPKQMVFAGPFSLLHHKILLYSLCLCSPLFLWLLYCFQHTQHATSFFNQIAFLSWNGKARHKGTLKHVKQLLVK